MKISLNWLKDHVDLTDIDLTWLINKLTITTAEIEGVEHQEGDTILEIDNKSITNRPDLWCHRGMAREVAAITGRSLKDIEVLELEKEKGKPALTVRIEDQEKCLRYSAVRIDQVKAAASPEPMAKRLTACGMQPVNLLVDLANYVMLDIGQPLHAFEGESVEEICVKSIGEAVSLHTLDKAERELPAGTLMICDGNKPAAIAGIIGGQESAVSEGTVSILLEAAVFDGVAIRKTASALGIRTDASMRYEKFLDTALTVTALGRYLKLLREYQPEAQLASSLYDCIIRETPPVEIHLPHKYIETYLGNSLDRNTVRDILGRLEFEVSLLADSYSIKVPSFRATRDISGKADVIEEILRMYGYDRIKGVPHQGAVDYVKADSLKEMEEQLKDLLTEKFSFHEVHTYCWYDKEWLKKLGYEYQDTLGIVNSDVNQFEKLRSDLAPNLLQVLYNNRRSFGEIKAYEVARAFQWWGESLRQEKHLIAGSFSSGKPEETYLYMKGLASCLVRAIKNIEVDYVPIQESYRENCLLLRYEGLEFGRLYTVPASTARLYGGKHSIHLLDINLERLNAIQKQEIKYKPLSKYPETYLDFSILTDKKMAYQELRDIAAGFRHPLLQACEYLGTYSGENVPEGLKSTTLRVVLGTSERTLQLEEINDLKVLFIEHLAAWGLELRG